MRLSVVIPAHDEERNLPLTLDTLLAVLRREAIPCEVIVVNDNSADRTREVVRERLVRDPELVLINNTPPGGFGRAVRAGLENASGDAVAIVMADRSDDPEDVVRCYRKLLEGWDCVFGSRFRPDSVVIAYPRLKLLVNRVVNTLLRLLFVTPLNDLTNAFKVYRRSALQGIGPLQACHFNVTVELSLSCVIRGYRIAEIPINWYGRTWGVSHLRLREMGRRYLATTLKLWFERLLIADDLRTEAQRSAPAAREVPTRRDRVTDGATSRDG